MFQVVSRVVMGRPKTPAGWVIGLVSLLVLVIVAALLLIPREVSPGQLDVSALPLLNAGLNGTSGILLAAGYVFIRRRQVERHRFCMLSAFGLSALFLVSYVVYHAVAGSTSFTGQGWIRPVYFAILISHIILPRIASGLDHAVSCLAGHIRSASRDRPLDIADLALCLG
jgi:putative membrane protein